MKWLTYEEVTAAAKKSKKAATACSKKHWLQLSTATADELRCSPRYPLSPAFCALCMYHGGPGGGACKPCSLYCEGRGRACCYEYSAAFDAYYDWKEKTGTFAAWKKAAKAMYQRICKIKD